MQSPSRTRFMELVIGAAFIVAGTATHVSATLWTTASQPSIGTTLTGDRTAVDPVRNRIYLPRLDNLVVLDGATHQPIAQASLGYRHYGIALELDRQQVLLTEDGLDGAAPRLHVHDANTLALVETIPLPHRPYYQRGIDVDGTTGLVWIADGWGNYLTAIDLGLAPGAPGRVRTFPACASALAVNTRTSYVYATCTDGSLRVVDGHPARPAFGQTVANLATGPGWMDLAVLARRNEVYVMKNGCPGCEGNEVVIVDGDPGNSSFHQVVGALALNNKPGPAPPEQIPSVALGVNPVTERIFVKVSDSDWGWDVRSALMVFDAGSRSQLSVSLLPDEQTATVGSVVVNPVTNRAYVSNGFLVTVVQDTVVQQASTTASETTVDLTSLSLEFTGGVSSGGVTTATPIDATTANLSLPGQFSIAGAPAYEISTTVAFTDEITLCFATGVEDPDVFYSLVVLHGVDGAWVPEETTHNFDTREVCATVSSLSPFVIARVAGAYSVQPIFDTSKAFRSGSTAPLKIRLLDAWGANASSAGLVVRATSLVQVSTDATSVVQDAGNANADSNFRYDASLGGYIFNFSTKGLRAGTYELRVRAAGDSNVHVVPFQVR